MFVINIATAPFASVGVLLPSGLAVSSSPFTAQLPFPDRGQVATFNFKIPLPLPFELKAEVSFGPETLEFMYVSLMDGDVLNILRHDELAFTSTVFHSQQQRPPVQCMAICADGSRAPGCIVCRSKRVTAKICC